MPACTFCCKAADADHEELVEVGLEDGQELEPFQQRHLRVLSFLQDAAVELQPTQLAVDVERRVRQTERGRGAVTESMSKPPLKDEVAL